MQTWEVVGAEIFVINNKNILCIVENYSKFPVVNKISSLSANGLACAVKMTFSEFGLPRKNVSNARMNFKAENFKEFCRKLNIQQSITSSYHYQSSGQYKQTICCSVDPSGAFYHK